MKKASETVERYTYRVIWSEEDHAYVGLCAELPSMSWVASSQSKALEGIVAAAREAVEDMVASEEPAPEPIAARKYSGIFKVRIPPEVHRRLVTEAAESHISLNRLVSAKLAAC